MTESSEYYASARKLVENERDFQSPTVLAVAKKYQEWAAVCWANESWAAENGDLGAPW